MDSWIDSKWQTHWFDMTKLPILRGKETYILTSAIDISHLKPTEPALIDNGNLIRALASALPLPFLLITQNQIQFANKAACERLGLDAAALIGQPAGLLLPNWEAWLKTGSGELQLPRKESAPIAVHIRQITGNDSQVYLLTLD
jgi:PAS domain-containing protein